MRWCWVLYAALLAAQDPRGTFTGQVTDGTGAVIPGATVRATHAETGTAFSARTNAQGSYEIPFLLPGLYKIEAEHTGFKRWSQAEVELRISDRVQVDVKLEVGSVEQTVEVTAEAPLLESAEGGVGQVVGREQVSELPLRGASLASLYAMAPGVVVESLSYDGPWNIQQASSFVVGGVGAGGGGVDFSLDGIGNNSYSGQTAFVPPADMVQEVRIQTNIYDASVGHTMGGSINVSLKSGTNAFHGSVGALGMAGPLLTRNFFVDQYIFNPATGPVTAQKIHDNTPAVRWLRYSAVVGGPLVVPKVYDGHNRTFWIFGMQIHNRQRPIAAYYTVPRAAEKNGDFSALLGLGASYQIYDPATATPTSATRYSRAPFAGNIIPASRISAVGRLVAGYYPAPNTPGGADGQNDYFRTRPETQNLYQPEGRVDHYFNEKHRMFARYTHSDFFGHFDQIVAGSTVRGRRRQRPHRGVALDDVYVLGGATVLDVRYGFTWFREYQAFDNQGWDLTKFGFPQSLIAQMDPGGITFPETAVTGLMQLGQDGGFTQNNYSHSLLATLDKVRGNHALKAGVDARAMYDNTTTYGNVAPHFDFAAAYTRGPVDNSAASSGFGQGLASLLLGIPTGGYADINSSRADASKLYSVFLQDNWRASKRLTVNAGVRYEYESPVTERYNRATRDFDMQTVNPIQALAQAQYARSPIPQLAALRTVGGVTFAGVNGNPRGFRDPYRKAVMPRLGTAYRLSQRVVLRGGVGFYFAPSGADFMVAQQPGFSQQTQITPSLDSGLTFAASISNPLPGGLAQPVGAAGGLKTYLGRAPGFFPSRATRAYNQRWSYTMQVEPARRLLVEVGYIGSRAIHLPASTDLNPVPRQYMSTLPERDATAINLLTGTVANPFAGIDGFQASTYYTAVTIGRQQLLKPYPQFSGLTASLPAGSSWYHALTGRLERRFRGGLQFQASFTHSKTMEAISYLNPTDNAPEHVISNLDRPNRLVASGMWELPFGRRRAGGSWLRGLRNNAIGGWRMQTLFQTQTGPPLAFGNVLYRGLIGDIPLGADARSLQEWFNTDGFERTSGKQLAQNIRGFPSRLSGARADGINTVDVSMSKTFRVREGFRVQFRCEAEGVANHPNFAAPNTAPANVLFGQVSATQTGQEERRISLGLKLIF
jgi:hypothetical protein